MNRATAGLYSARKSWQTDRYTCERPRDVKRGYLAASKRALFGTSYTPSSVYTASSSLPYLRLIHALYTRRATGHREELRRLIAVIRRTLDRRRLLSFCLTLGRAAFNTRRQSLLDYAAFLPLHLPVH